MLASTNVTKSFAAELVQHIGDGWDEIGGKFSDFVLEQSAAYMTPRWGDSRLNGLLLRSAMSGEIEAAALIVVAALPLINAGIAYVKFGPMWRHAGQPARPMVLQAILQAISDHFAKVRGLLVRVMPPAEPARPLEWLTSLSSSGYRLHRTVPHPERYLVNLTLSENEQLASLTPKWRANLRKANGQLMIREADPASSLSTFMELYNSMQSRKRFSDHHHIEHLPAFLKNASAQVNLRMFLAETNGQPVAASLVVSIGERAVVPFSASSAAALPLRAGFALRWEIIKRLHGSPALWLDIGGDEGDLGLRHFKAGNSGSAGCIAAIPGEFDYAGNRLSASVATLLGWAQDRRR